MGPANDANRACIVVADISLNTLRGPIAPGAYQLESFHASAQRGFDPDRPSNVRDAVPAPACAVSLRRPQYGPL